MYIYILIHWGTNSLTSVCEANDLPLTSQQTVIQILIENIEHIFDKVKIPFSTYIFSECLSGYREHFERFWTTLLSNDIYVYPCHMFPVNQEGNLLSLNLNLNLRINVCDLPLENSRLASPERTNQEIFGGIAFPYQ